MPVFISYSQEDREFVDELAARLVEQRVWVWLDRWELKVGDSLVARIEEAIGGASALLLILSKASVESPWFKKEMTAGLMRELDEDRVLLMPAIIEDCSIPLFLREKLCADFRSDYDGAFRNLMEGLAGVCSDSLGRIEEPNFHVDWGIDWGYGILADQEVFRMEITMVEHGADIPFSALTQVSISANGAATSRQRTYDTLNLGWFRAIRFSP